MLRPRVSCKWFVLATLPPACQVRDRLWNFLSSWIKQRRYECFCGASSFILETKHYTLWQFKLPWWIQGGSWECMIEAHRDEEQWRKTLYNPHEEGKPQDSVRPDNCPGFCNGLWKCLILAKTIRKLKKTSFFRIVLNRNSYLSLRNRISFGPLTEENSQCTISICRFGLLSDSETLSWDDLGINVGGKNSVKKSWKKIVITLREKYTNQSCKQKVFSHLFVKKGFSNDLRKKTEVFLNSLPIKIKIHEEASATWKTFTSSFQLPKFTAPRICPPSNSYTKRASIIR